MSAHSPYRQRSDALNVTVSLCLCYTLFFFLVGVYLRLKSRSYKWDDAVAVVATVLSLGQFATQYIALAHGQGRSTDYLTTSPNLNLLNSVNRAGVILFFLTLYTSKGAAVALLHRFAPLRRHKLSVYISFAFLLLLGLVSILLLNIDCGLTGTLFWHISKDSSLCQSQYTRWQVTTAFDIASEILILLVPIDMIWSLQMKSTSKLGVLSRFWMRLPVLALAIGRFLYIRNLLFTQDVGVASNQALILQEVQMAASLSAPVIVTLRPFTKDFNTGFGQGGEVIAAYGASKGYGSNAMKQSGSSTQRSFGHKIATRLGLTSRGGGNVSALRSGRSEKVGKGGDMDLEDLRRRDTHSPRETSESVKGLTRDVITQTIDFEVQYEDSYGKEESERGSSGKGHDRF